MQVLFDFQVTVICCPSRAASAAKGSFFGPFWFVLLKETQETSKFGPRSRRNITLGHKSEWMWIITLLLDSSKARFEFQCPFEKKRHKNSKRLLLAAESALRQHIISKSGRT